MARDYVINGETMVAVKGIGALSTLGGVGGFAVPKLFLLGLAEKEVRVIPRWKHKDVYIDDFGPDVPAEVLWMLADVRIQMTLSHYDPLVLDAVVAESMGGGVSPVTGLAGVLAGAGTPMGGGAPLFGAGCHYVSLNLASPVLSLPWRFPTAYLDAQPLEIPLGTEKTLVVLSWRAIPYQNFASGLDTDSAGVVLWSRQADTP